MGFVYFPPGRKALIDALGNCSSEVRENLLFEYFKGEPVKSTAVAIVHDDFCNNPAFISGSSEGWVLCSHKRTIHVHTKAELYSLILYCLFLTARHTCYWKSGCGWVMYTVQGIWEGMCVCVFSVSRTVSIWVGGLLWPAGVWITYSQLIWSFCSDFSTTENTLIQSVLWFSQGGHVHGATSIDQPISF